MPVAVKNKMDKAVDALFQCLPAASVEEIRRRLQKELGYRVNTGFANKVLHENRCNVAKHGWVVAYAKNGAGDPTHDKRRYFAMLVDKKESGGFYMDPEFRRHFGGGMQSKLAGAITVLANSAVMIDVMTQYERSTNRREFWEDNLETLNFVVKKGRRFVAALKMLNIA